MSLGIKRENVCTYPFAALSAGLLERKGPREYVVKHFAEIAHPALKLGWAVGLFNKGAALPEIIRFLRAALESKEQAQELRAMYGPDFEWFKKRLNQIAPHESPVMRAVRKSKPALVFIQELTGKGGGQGEGAPPRPVLGILLDARGTVVTNDSLIKGGKQLAVVLSDGRRLPAKAMHSDPTLDLAVIRVEDGKPLPHATVGDSEKVKAGDGVLALSAPWKVAVGELPVVTRGVTNFTSGVEGRGTTGDWRISGTV
jgi:S1-C subfamily serine protease